MSCRDIRLRFSEALDAAPNSRLRASIEEHCEGCAICGPEWQSLLRLESMMGESPEPPKGFADRVMSALPAVKSPRREAVPFVAAGLVAAALLVAFQFSAVTAYAAPWLAGGSDFLRGLRDSIPMDVPAGWTLPAYLVASLAVAGAASCVAILKLGRTTN